MPLPYINIQPICTCGHEAGRHYAHGPCNSRACDCASFDEQLYPPYADLDDEPADWLTNRDPGDET